MDHFQWQALTPALQRHLAKEGGMACFRMVFFDGEEAYKQWSRPSSSSSSLLSCLDLSETEVYEL